MIARFSLFFILLFSMGKQLLAQDVWLQNHFSPVGACSLTNAENVQVLINNNSAAVMPSNTIQVYYSVDGGVPVNQALSSNLLPGASWNFTFSVKADLSACGTYFVKVWVARPGDVNHLNDTLLWDVTNSCFNAPGAISGAVTVCQGQNAVSYTFPAMLNATGYNWTLPNGASGSSSTNSIAVDYSTTATAGNITVAGTNACGSSAAATLPVSVNPLPDAGGTISGSSTVCQGESGLTYTVPVMANALSYQWTLPGGATGASTTNQIVLDYSTSAVSGPLTVMGTNACGNGVAAVLPVTVNPLPAAAGTISGSTDVCQGESGVTYTVAPIANASAYQWTLPNGATGASTTNQIVLDYSTSAVSGPLTVIGTNTCGNGVAALASVTVNPLPEAAGSISGTPEVCQPQNAVNYSIPLVTNASAYSWTLPNGATGVSTTNNIVVDYSANVVPGLLTVTPTNACGNGAASSVSITVNTDPPIAICQNITALLDATGHVSVTPAQVNNGSSDACGITSLALDVTDFDCNNVGTNTVTLTVTDNNGYSSTCTSTVTVVDTVAPVVACQPVTVQLDAAGNASITAAQVDNGSVDACGTVTLSVTPNTFNCLNVGANTVTLTATDVNGNSSSCTAIVTVQDTIAPVTICRNITVQLDANGNAAITAADVTNPNSADACGINSATINVSAFDCSNTGPNPVVLTLTDVNGNSSSCVATVTVEDTTAPVAICHDITVQLNGTGSVTITGAQVNNGSTDLCGIASVTVLPATFDCSNIGANTVTLTVTDNSGNSSTCTATVTVEDTVAPVAICQGITVQLDANGNATITAADINNGSADACGIATTSVDITDFDCSNIGPNTVILTVTDVNGNSSGCTATVTVQDTTAPVASCRNITVQLDASGSVTVTGAQIDNGSSDLCSAVAVTVSPNTFDCSNVGANTVTLTVTDASGNTSACTATVTVEDTIAPTAICQNINVPLNANGTASITAAQVNNGSTDACGIASVTVWPNNFTCANTGANTVTLTVTDVNGNTASCTAVVTVTASGTAVGTTLNQTICSGLAYPFNGQQLTASGTYYDTLTTVNGCDSIITLNLTVSFLNTSNISASICPTGFYNFYGDLLADAGVYTDTVPSVGGCDTIVILTLTKTIVNTNATVSGNVCTAAQAGAAYQWYTCNTSQPIAGATGQSYTATQPGSYQCLVTFDSCAVPTICVLVNPTGVADITSYKFSLYPNPNTGLFTIQHDYTGETEVAIENMLGQKVKQFNMASTTGYFDMADFAAGIYNVVITSGHERLAVIRVVKQ